MSDGPSPYAIASAVENAMRGYFREINVQVSNVKGDVGQVRSDLSSTTRELLELKQQFDEWVGESRRTAAVQRAETVVGNLKADLDRQFGHYNVVRRSSIGTLEALDLGLVTNKTVQQVSEELMIQTPKYWLAPALVALAAWSRDDKELADRAVSESYARDSSKCSLFFSLVLQRQNRLESATRWIRHYLRSLDPLNLPREFAVILEALARGGFGLHGRELIAEQLDEWLSMLRDDPQKISDQVELWKKDIRNYAGVVPSDAYQALREFSPTWPAIERQLVSASALGNTAEHYQTILDTKIEVSSDMLAKMDDLLEQLVREYDAEELPLRKQVAYQEAIIEYNGDIDRAQEKSDLDEKAMAETIDALSMQTYTAMMPDLLGVSVQTQIVSIGSLKQEFRAAATSYTAEYRSKAVSVAEVSLGADHSNAAMQFGFPGWKTSTTVRQDVAEQQLAGVWNSTMEKYKQEVAFKPTKLIAPIIIVFFVVFVAFAIAWPAGLVFLLLGGGGVALYGWNLKTKAEKEIAAIEANQQTALEYSIDRYRTTTVEFTDAIMTYEDADAKEEQLLTLIDHWPSVTPGEEDA